MLIRNHILFLKLQQKATFRCSTRVHQATKYYDKESVEIHCREKLQEKGDTNKWIFIFDGTGYTLRHAMEIGVSLSFLRVVKEHADTLLEIRILNTSSYVSTMLTIMKPFIPHKIYSKINWNTMN